ncbi:hypothetical protein BDN70DRAFT_880338 [Pholiota conissans]|uniref:BTB domain-containing protein n=1 Tax=Pholiota conissans TaxID=109636 RepID=A0A9P5YYX3_9AGAR|nr:hypothetical protein BDN70DRAFT_880338 [Pholiota conissans]
MLGDHKYKLEIAPIPLEGEGGANTSTSLSLYITSLVLDFAQEEHETHASMMAAIKCQDDRIGERGARPEWIWEFWQNDWVFRHESEVWECPLPPLSVLLQNSRISEVDSFVLCVQIHSPVGPSIPQHPSIYHVPRDLLDGLEASLDNPNTGDVRFVCLEKYSATRDLLSHSTTSATSGSVSPGPFSNHSTARKRIIYAHSDILNRRSEYFATMLSSAFAENSGGVTNGERKLYTVVVEEADFETIYWLLKYCYANWLLFKQDDDPRNAVEGVGAGWSAKWLVSHQGEWDWTTFHRGGASEDGTADNRSATSGESVPVSSAIGMSTSRKSDTYQQPVATPIASSSRVIPLKSTPTAGSSAPKNPVNPASASRGSSSTISRTTGSSTVGVPGAKSINVQTSSTFPTSPQYTHSPRSARNPASVSSPDPHPHPTPTPPPASALSIYQVAHRYVMPNLAALALEHIMSTITPQSSFALLLATAAWEELHLLVEDYVVDKWDEVSLSTGFEDCCKEVAAGEWGVDGGKTLMSVFRRLRSPAPAP